MKNYTILLAGALLALSSCGKQDQNEVKPKQTITYSVECDYCAVWVEDNNWNRKNKSVKNQSFAVNGKWSYTFENSQIDTASLSVGVGAMNKSQNIKAKISTNDGYEVSFNELFGDDEASIFNKSIELEVKL